jgi:hypothetical protein
MLKKVLFATVASALLAAVALPVQVAPAAAGPMSCKAAAKAKFHGSLKMRHEFRKECKAHWKASQQKA